MVLLGCSFEHGTVPSGSPDGSVDGTSDDVDAPPSGVTCLGADAYQVCVPPPAMSVTLSGTIDTATAVECAPAQPSPWIAAGQPESCFIIGTSISITGMARVVGARPLVLVASNAISISGTLDASTKRGEAKSGPGAPAASCRSFTQDPEANSSGPAGGAGGTFMTKGGDGGDGAASNVEGRAPNPEPAPMRLRAGCNGQRGGTGDEPPGAPGAGGGAVYLVAGGMITISGTINASGAGGANGSNDATKSGGSGGGSGGMIKLHAAGITIGGAGAVMANGGGAASGSDENGGGNFGSDPQAADVRAPGGASISNSGAGGGGFAVALPAVDGEKATGNNTGGGGGGGGGGFIQSNVTLTGGTISAGVIDDP